MQDTIYTIDQSQLDSLMKRMLITMLKKLGIIILSISVLQYLSVGRHDFKPFLISISVTTLLVLVVSTLTVKKRFRKIYETLKIVLNEQGVEVKAEMTPYRSISWNNLIVKEQVNGTIDLYDNRISKISRKWSGNGWIRIQPEIANRDMLLNELIKRGTMAV